MTEESSLRQENTAQPCTYGCGEGRSLDWLDPDRLKVLQ
jgi:hypothetical protein